MTRAMWDFAKRKPVTALAVVVTVAWFGSLQLADYADPLSGCFIEIDGWFGAWTNESAIVEALEKVEQENIGDYQRICRYVDRIVEGACAFSDWHLNPGFDQERTNKNCYLKGSKTIYLWPVQRKTDFIVDQRAAALARLARLSEEFWTQAK